MLEGYDLDFEPFDHLYIKLDPKAFDKLEDIKAHNSFEKATLQDDITDRTWENNYHKCMLHIREGTHMRSWDYPADKLVYEDILLVDLEEHADKHDREKKKFEEIEDSYNERCKMFDHDKRLFIKAYHQYIKLTRKDEAINKTQTKQVV